MSFRQITGKDFSSVKTPLTYRCTEPPMRLSLFSRAGLSNREHMRLSENDALLENEEVDIVLNVLD